jgi:hypothetical protein
VQEHARQHTTTAIDTLAEIMRNENAAPAARIAAANALLDRGYGKPGQTVGETAMRADPRMLSDEGLTARILEVEEALANDCGEE